MVIPPSPSPWATTTMMPPPPAASAPLLPQIATPPSPSAWATNAMLPQPPAEKAPLLEQVLVPPPPAESIERLRIETVTECAPDVEEVLEEEVIEKEDIILALGAVEHPSIGSAAHYAGNCRPCIF